MKMAESPIGLVGLRVENFLVCSGDWVVSHKIIPNAYLQCLAKSSLVKRLARIWVVNFLSIGKGKFIGQQPVNLLTSCAGFEYQIEAKVHIVVPLK